MIGICWSDEAQRQSLENMLSLLGRDVVCSAAVWLEEQQTACDLLVMDERAFAALRDATGVGRQAIIVVGGEDRAEPAVHAVRQGAVDYLPDSMGMERLAARCSDVSVRLAQQDFVAQSQSSAELFRLASRVARTDVAIMLNGESGTGKEVVARHVHAQSARADAPFVAVNCAALPENMLEAILFGHEKGAFTGATESRPGKFEQAEHGTLLLDEITEMPLALQAKLLRVLQEREVERLGAKRPRRVDVRVIATSNRDLARAVAEGQFREDLYYRLSVFPLTLKPLRSRPEDIMPLANHFLRKHLRLRPGRPAAVFSSAAQQILVQHDWPGNVRELENAVQRALVMCDGDVIESHHLDLGLASLDQAAADLGSRMLHAEGETIVAALRAHDGRRNTTAKALGISERTLRYKLKKLRDLGMEVD